MNLSTRDLWVGVLRLRGCAVGPHRSALEGMMNHECKV